MDSCGRLVGQTRDTAGEGKKIKQERLALIRQQKEIAAKKAEEAREAARKLEEEKAKAVSETQEETKPEVFRLKKAPLRRL